VSARSSLLNSALVTVPVLHGCDAEFAIKFRWRAFYTNKLIIISPLFTIVDPQVLKMGFVEKSLRLMIRLFIFYCPHFYFASSVAESNWQTPLHIRKVRVSDPILKTVCPESFVIFLSILFRNSGVQ